MHDLLVDRDAHGPGESAVPLERRQRALLANEGLDLFVDLERRHPGLDDLPDERDDVGEDVTAAAHQRDLALGLEDDHRAAPARPRADPTASRSAWRIVSTWPSPLTVRSRPRER